VICPYCDSLIRELPDNRTCPQCGAPLGSCIEGMRKPKKKLVFPEAPVGVYKDAAGYLKIEKDSITFYRNQWPAVSAKMRTIPLDEIVAVSFGKARPFCAGFLCVREWQDRHFPLATKSREIVFDETSVYFRPKDNEKFLKVYQFLRSCADVVNASRYTELNTSLLGKYKGFYGYMELGEHAVSFFKNVPFKDPMECVIPYDEIAEVKIQQAMGTKRGGLSIRKRDESKMLDVVLGNAIVDDSSIDFEENQNQKMLEVYAFLTDHVRSNFKQWSL